MTKLILLLAYAVFSVSAQPVTVFLVRHAEKASTPADDPPLTAAGKVRAKSLASMLRDAQISAVFTSEFKRTIETGRPTADRFKLTITKVPGAAPDELRKRILTFTGKAVLVTGHTNTIPPLIEALGGPADIVIDEFEYDRRLILDVTSATSSTLVPLRYGSN